MRKKGKLSPPSEVTMFVCLFSRVSVEIQCAEHALINPHTLSGHGGFKGWDSWDAVWIQVMEINPARFQRYLLRNVYRPFWWTKIQVTVMWPFSHPTVLQPSVASRSASPLKYSLLSVLPDFLQTVSIFYGVNRSQVHPSSVWSKITDWGDGVRKQSFRTSIIDTLFEWNALRPPFVPRGEEKKPNLALQITTSKYERNKESVAWALEMR